MDTGQARRASPHTTSRRGSRACTGARWGCPRASRTGPGAPSPSFVSSQYLARYDELLDLRRALVDLRDLPVTEAALDLVLADVAVAAVDLDGVGRHLHRGLSGEVFRHGRRLHVRLARILERRGPQREQPRALDGRGHVGQHPLDHLVLTDGDAERLAFAGIGD